jgi:hypothetical protein
MRRGGAGGAAREHPAGDPRDVAEVPRGSHQDVAVQVVRLKKAKNFETSFSLHRLKG